MKHKAQESFEHMTKHIDGLHWLYNHKIIQENYENDKELMQEFINCQLTVEEIIAIQSFVANCSNYITKQAKLGLIGAESLANINVLLPEIFSANKKLNKQKEMWVSEDGNYKIFKKW